MRLVALFPPEPLPLAVVAAIALAPTLTAQEHEHHHDAARLGRVVFPGSCSAADQQRFEHAMAVLHSFWWEEGDNA
jgi:hypothetical protein